MEKLDYKIEALVKAKEGIDQQEVLDELHRSIGKSTRTIWSHMRNLDGRTIKRVREGRRVRLFSMGHWGRIQAHALELQAAHAVKLRGLLEEFRNRTPLVDEFGAYLADAGPVPHFSYGPRFEYDPRNPLDFEENRLFDDLLYHLGLMELPVDPSEAWPRFKAGVSKLASAHDSLWKGCKKIVEKSLGLPLRASWSGEMVSEGYVGLLYRQMVDTRLGRPKLADLSPLGGSEVERIDNWWEFRRNGVGLLRRRVRAAEDQEQFRAWLKRRLIKLAEAAADPDLVGAAHMVHGEAALLRKIRGNLVAALGEALVHEAFPGICRYTAFVT